MVDDLNYRALVDGGDDSRGIHWANIVSDPDYKAGIQKLTRYVPMSSVGMRLDQLLETENYRMTTVPLYPLAGTYLEKPDYTFISGNEITYQKMNYFHAEMKVGDYSYTNYLKVNGYNVKNSPYSAFKQGYGTWIVADENGNDITGTSTAPVELKNDVSGQRYTAVRPGTCYLKYIIYEDVYTSYQNSNVYATNASLSGSAAPQITVTEPEHDEDLAELVVEGSYEGIANGQPELLCGEYGDENKLSVTAIDRTGKEIEDYTDYEWDPKESKNKGMTLAADGTVTFTKPGYFHVRVKHKLPNGKRSIPHMWRSSRMRTVYPVTAAVLPLVTSPMILRSIRKPGRIRFLKSKEITPVSPAANR